jgi:hypothetical protein
MLEGPLLGLWAEGFVQAFDRHVVMILTSVDSVKYVWL